jgi:hypothetical protein
MIESETDKSFSQSTLQQSAQKHINPNDTAILQREREINDIAKGIIELADIFKELQTMVIDQGTMLDRIDYNVEKMTTHVKAAEKELVVVRLDNPPREGREALIITGNGLPAEDDEAQGHYSAPNSGHRHVHRLAGEAQAKSQCPRGGACLFAPSRRWVAADSA